MLQKKKKDGIDSKFHQQIKDFQEEIDASSKELETKIVNVQNRISVLKKKDFSILTDDELMELSKLKLELPEFQNKLTQVKSKSVSQYFLHLGPTLSNYYKALETRNYNLPSFQELAKGEGQSENLVQQISQAYHGKTDPLNNYEHSDSQLQYFCVNCHIERELNTNEGLLTCPNCLDSESIVVHTDKPNYNDSPCDNIYFAYQRINHFREKLAKTQQKDGFKIPRPIEDKLCEMFNKIQDPFFKHCPPDKPNFTSYNYVINKCLHIIKHPEYAKYFPLLKSKDNVYKADVIWKKICQELKYPFYPSN